MPESIMSVADNHPSFSRAALFGAGGVVLLALVAATMGRITGPVASEPQSTQVATRDLRFTDNADGSVTVLDARDNAPIMVVAPGTNGFLRATLRGLANARKFQAFGAEEPFRLTQWADGRLTLLDPDTNRRLELEAFGQTNEEVFARLLPGAAQTAASQTAGAK